MPQLKQTDFISEQQYLDEESNREIKHEYVNGQIFAMAGASKNHSRIVMNLSAAFLNHLKNSSCEPYSSDLKVKTATENYRYPDMLVVCDDDDPEYFTESPTIIVEVLSKSTRHTDRGDKLLEYINLPTLQEYVLIEQDFVSIDVLRRSEGWIPRNYALGDDVPFQSVDLTLSVAEIYNRVQNEDMQEFLASQE